MQEKQYAPAESQLTIVFDDIVSNLNSDFYYTANPREFQ